MASALPGQVGDAEERSPGAGVADAAGEEAALPAATRLLQALPHHGDQPQGAGQQGDALPGRVSMASVVSVHVVERTRTANHSGDGGSSSSGAGESAPGGPHLRVRAPPRGEGQHAEDVQQHPRRANMQGESASSQGTSCMSPRDGVPPRSAGAGSVPPSDPRTASRMADSTAGKISLHAE